jgi:hypothetical protein
MFGRGEPNTMTTISRSLLYNACTIFHVHILWRAISGFFLQADTSYHLTRTTRDEWHIFFRPSFFCIPSNRQVKNVSYIHKYQAGKQKEEEKKMNGIVTRKRNEWDGSASPGGCELMYISTAIVVLDHVES